MAKACELGAYRPAHQTSPSQRDARALLGIRELLVRTRTRWIVRYDAEARAQRLSPTDRLTFHQAHSGPVMDELHAWLAAQLDQHRIEPNSGLGKAINYFLNHWTPLTLFLRQPGAPLDNNIVERSLKRAILHRKNAYFYRTSNGAHVGDLS